MINIIKKISQVMICSRHYVFYLNAGDEATNKTNLLIFSIFLYSIYTLSLQQIFSYYLYQVIYNVFIVCLQYLYLIYGDKFKLYFTINK